MCHTTLLDSKFVEFLVRTDNKMAEEARRPLPAMRQGAASKQLSTQTPWHAARVDYEVL